jgi:hypothetical protein
MSHKIQQHGKVNLAVLLWFPTEIKKSSLLLQEKNTINKSIKRELI